MNKVQVKTAVFVAMVLGVILSALLLRQSPLPGIEAIKSWLSGLGLFAPFAYVAVMAVIVATPIPSLPLNFAAGAVFGPYLGTLLSVIGATSGALISFFIARLLGREVVERLLKSHILFCAPCSDRLLTKMVFLGRLLPVVSFDLISYGAGLTHMSVRNFALANLLGMLPLTFVYNYFGSAVTVGRGVSEALGVLFVSMFFVIPWLIEKKNFLGLRRYFEHPEHETLDAEGRQERL